MGKGVDPQVMSTVSHLTRSQRVWGVVPNFLPLGDVSYAPNVCRTTLLEKTSGQKLENFAHNFRLPDSFRTESVRY